MEQFPTSMIYGADNNGLTQIKAIGALDDQIYLLARLIKTVSAAHHIEIVSFLGGLNMAISELNAEPDEQNLEIKVDFGTIKQLLNFDNDKGDQNEENEEEAPDEMR